MVTSAGDAMTVTVAVSATITVLLVVTIFISVAVVITWVCAARRNERKVARNNTYSITPVYVCS